MIKGNSVLDKPIIDCATGQPLGQKIQDLIVAADRNEIAGFWVKAANCSGEIRTLPLDAIARIGADAIAIDSEDAIVPARSGTNGQNPNDVRNRHIITTDGRDLGQAIDVYFDPETGAVEGYEVCGGLFADAATGKTFVPATPILQASNMVVIVPPETGDMMKEQEPQAIPETLAPIVPPAAFQKTFAIGKIAREEVRTPNGSPLIVPGQLITSAHAAVAQNRGVLEQLYRAAGGNCPHSVRTPPTTTTARTLACIARPVVARARGRRTRELVQNKDGSIIAAPGQIVTERVIARAKKHHREKALLYAVGLSADESMEIACTAIASSEETAVEKANLELGYLWTIACPANEEEQTAREDSNLSEQIQNALGRPVVRVIRDKHDRVILDVGDLVTYPAIERARQADTLDKLLNSVYE